MTNLRLDVEEHEAFPSMLDDALESARYVEDEDAVTRQFETSLVEHKWIVQVTQLDRRMLSTQQLLAELHAGTLVNAETLVWRGGMEDWLPLIDVADLPIAGLSIEREWLDRRSRRQLRAEGRRSLVPSRLLATLPPAAIVRRLQRTVSLHPAALSPTPLGAILWSSALAFATILVTLYALSKGGVFDASAENPPSPTGSIRRAQAALSVAKDAPQRPKHTEPQQTEPAPLGAQAGN